jgi:hypothetical protein
MRRSLVFPIAAVLLCALGVVVPATVRATDGDGMQISGPAKLNGVEGYEFSLYVHAGYVDGIGGFEFTVLFDDSALSFVSAAPSEYVIEAGTVFCPAPVVQPGQMRFACSLIGGASVKGAVELAQVRFQVDQEMAGVLQFGMQDCQLAGPLGDPLAFDGCKGAEVIVHEPPPSAPMVMSPSFVKMLPEPGMTFTLDVVISDVADLGGAEFAVEFDETIFAVDLRQGPFMDTTTFSDVCFEDAPEPGRVRFACVILGKDEAASGSGVFAHIDFEVVAAFQGSTALVLNDCDLADSQGVNLPVAECTGTKVQGNLGPLPTFTPGPPPPVGGLSFDAISPRTASKDAWQLALVVAAFLLLAALCALRARRSTR